MKSFKLQVASLKTFYSEIQSLVEQKLWVKVIIGMILGIAGGAIISPAAGIIPEAFSSRIGSWAGLPGTIFLQIVQMIMIPLILTSIVQGIIGSGSLEQLRKMGGSVLVYFLFTTTIAITIGISLSYIIKPGSRLSKLGTTQSTDVAVGEKAEVETDIPSLIGQLIPDNPLASMVAGDMLAVVIVAIVVGIALASLSSKKAQPVVDLLSSVQQVCMTIVNFAMKLVPYAVFGLMVQLIANLGWSSLTGLSIYMGTVAAGLVVLICIYAILIFLLGRQNPFQALSKMRDAQLLAFSTASSAAVMPLTMKTADEKLKVKPAVSNFLIPVGATVNMDGTALNQAVALIFLTQVYGIPLELSDLLIITFTIVAASVGTPSIPGGGMIILGTIVSNFGVPASGIVILIGVDRILGMLRTAVNVTGDLTACTVFDKIGNFEAQGNIVNEKEETQATQKA